MARKTLPVVFPVKGLHEQAAYALQPPGTSPRLKNVRAHDPQKDRLRGGRRPGMSKWNEFQINGETPIQHMTKAVRSASYAEAFRDQVLVSTDRGDGAASVFVLDTSGNLIFAYDTGGSASGAARDADGNYYVTGTPSSSWAGNDGSTATVWKLNAVGEVEWTFNNGSSGSQEIVYDARFDRVGVIANASTTWDGNDGTARNVWVLNAQTGELIWSYSTGSTTGGFIAVDDDGSFYVTGDRNDSWTGSGGSFASAWKLSSAGSVLASYDPGDNADGIAWHESGRVVVSLVNANSTWAGNDGTPKNIFVLDADDLSVLKTFNKHAGSGKSALNIDWSIDGDYIVVSGGTVGGATTRKFAYSDGSDLWAYNAGGNSDALGINAADEVFIGATQNSAWDGNDGTNASVWRLDGQTGDVVWAYDTGGRATEIAVYREAGAGATTRETSLAVVAGGSVRKVVGENIITPKTSDDVLSATEYRVQGQNAYNRVFYVDGENSKVFDLAENEVVDWTADNGTLPSECRLIALYRGRLVLSGKVADAHNWFMSRVGDPFDWDYSPATTSSIDAVAGNNSDAGLCGDIITALIPYSDDVLLMGGDSSIWQMTGDPAAGGAIDLVSDQTGIAFGKAWAKDPANSVYFMGVDGIYRMRFGSQPESITRGRMDRRFENIDLAANRVILAWDFIRKGLVVQVHPIGGEAAVTGYFWDARADAWWPEDYPTVIGPSAIYAYDAEEADDKALMLGSRDGYIRKLDDEADDDDGNAIESYARFAPMQVGDQIAESRLSEVYAIMGEGSADVTLRVYAGQSAEEASLAATPRFTKTLGSGRNNSVRQRVRGSAISLEIYHNGSERWSMEMMRAVLEVTGKARRRGR